MYNVERNVLQPISGVHEANTDLTESLEQGADCQLCPH